MTDIKELVTVGSYNHKIRTCISTVKKHSSELFVQSDVIPKRVTSYKCEKNVCGFYYYM